MVSEIEFLEGRLIHEISTGLEIENPNLFHNHGK